MKRISLQQIKMLKNIIKSFRNISNVINTTFNYKDAKNASKQTYLMMLKYNRQYPNAKIKSTDKLFRSSNDPLGLKNALKIDILYNNSHITNMINNVGSPYYQLVRYYTVSNLGNAIKAPYDFELNLASLYDKLSFEYKKQHVGNLAKNSKLIRKHLHDSHLSLTDLKSICKNISIKDYDYIMSMPEFKKTFFNRSVADLGTQLKNVYQAKLNIKDKQFDMKINNKIGRILNDGNYETPHNIIKYAENNYYVENHLLKFRKLQYRTAKNVLVNYQSVPVVAIRVDSDKNYFNVRPLLSYEVMGLIKQQSNQLDDLNTLKNLKINKKNLIKNAKIAKHLMKKYADSFDFGLSTSIIKHIYNMDLAYQKKRLQNMDLAKSVHEDSSIFVKYVKNNIKFDKKAIAHLKNTHYVNDSGKEYSLHDFNNAVCQLKKTIFLSYIKNNKKDAKFNPKLTNLQAHLVLHDMYKSYPFYASDKREKERAKQALALLDKQPNKMVSYRNIAPFHHYIYKRNLKMLAKEIK